MGKIIQSELSVLGSNPVHECELLEDVRKHYAVRITFRMQITADVDIQWDTILSGRKLYIQVADAQRPVGSKEGFLAMLEYAEEYLNVSHIIVCFAKNHPERNVLVRGFMFLGFSLQPPGLNKIVPHAAIDNCNHYMVYDVES